jgi:ribonucleoside-diphosphate reductase alpha chain
MGNMTTGKDKENSEKKSDDYYRTKPINLSQNAIKVLEKRYLKRDEEGNLLEAPRDMFARVAKNIASAEKNYVRDPEKVKAAEKSFFDVMTDLDFLPNSPTLMNAGKELQQLAACFVLPVGDSMEKIFEALKETALIQKSGGGVGYSFSNIRPKNDVVLSTKGVSSGPISFMTVFNAATDTIKQGGTRRGANMGILRVDHPDILEFITAKEDNSKLTNFNLSVGITEAFMKAVENDEEYEVINPRTKQVVCKYKAKEIFNKIIYQAWKNGDPGIVFLDRLNKDNPTPNIGRIESTNPCVSGDMLISTNAGFIKARKLHDMVMKNKEIKILFDKRALSYKATGEIEFNSLSVEENSNINSWNRGLKDVYKLSTYSGFELEATWEHKVLTTTGYKELGELRENDEILIQPYGKFSPTIEIFGNGKVAKLNNLTNKFIDKVKKVELIGQKEVFDFGEPLSNSYIANGIVVRNCGEQPLLPYEACNLGSINLAHMVKEDAGKIEVDYEKLRNVIKVAVRFLDDVIDMSRYPLKKIEEMARGNRKVGLGVMGWADLLIILGIPYNSEQALELAKEVMGFIQNESKIASRELADERGSFPNFKGSVYDVPDGHPVRNATTTTIAPTGTLSIIANCSSGIEPVFAISFVKNVMDNEKLVEVNPYFEKTAKEMDFYSRDLMEEIAGKGKLEGFEQIPSSVKRIFITAHEISPVWHVRMQAGFQENVDNAVSKTVNFSNSATEGDVEEVYMLAYRLGCKGITIYRDGSREGQVLQVEGKTKQGTGSENVESRLQSSTAAETIVAGTGAAGDDTGNSKKYDNFKKVKETEAAGGTTEPEFRQAAYSSIIPRSRPDITRGFTRKFKIGGCGKIYVTVNSDEQGICEVFTNTGEEGCAALSEAVGRLISITIRSGIEIDSILKQISGVRCITCIADEETHVLSCPDAMGKAIEFYLKGYNKFDFNTTGGPKSVMICPEEGCGGIMQPEGGCYVCRVCGFSKCS